MKSLLPLFLCACVLAAFLALPGVVAPPALAQSGKSDETIRTTIIIRSKASECPPNFVVFHIDSGKKMPLGPKICFVRSAKPAKK